MIFVRHSKTQFSLNKTNLSNLLKISTKHMNSGLYIKLGRLTALLSFLVGTAIFILYFLTSSFEILNLGYRFIALAGLINVVILISILFKANRDKDNRAKLFAACSLMLLNIPVLFLYCWVTGILLDTMRITFTNTTQTTLTNINIVGCGGGHIEKLENGESETVWVEITGDCSIGINYLSDGQKKEESVAGYVTTLMGQKMKHNIGGQNKKQF